MKGAIRNHRVFGFQILIIAFLVLGIVTTSQAKRATPIAHTKNLTPHLETAASRNVSRPTTASQPNLAVLVHLQEGQAALQRQVQNLIEINRRIQTIGIAETDTLEAQVHQVISSVDQQKYATQQLLSTVRSIRRLLSITIGLLLIACGALFFARRQPRGQVGPSPVKGKPIEDHAKNALDTATPWKADLKSVR